MGIHDRDYSRHSPRPIGPMFPRGLTVVQWLIIINIAVFVVDRFLPPIQVGMGQVWIQNANQDAPSRIDRTVQPQDLGNGMLGYPILQQVPNSGQVAVVGFERFRVMPLLQGIGHFSTLKAFTHLEIWRFITYQFLHANTSHILFNMIGLWVFGPMVLAALGSGRLFLAFYLTCGICGAFLYLILNLLGWQLGPNGPGFLVTQPWVPLVGASAAIFGILMAAAKVAGDAEILVFFVLPMKIRIAAYVFFAIAAANLFVIQGGNQGGDAAHVGGAIAGFILIRRPHWLLDFFDDFLGSSRPGSRRPSPKAHSKIDRILDKVHREGMSSLTERERKALARHAERPRSG